MATLPKDLLVRIKGSSTELEKAAQRSQSVLRRVGSAAKVSATAVAGIGAAAAGIAFAIKKGLIDPFTEQQAAVASLQAALTATGKVGADSLRAVADEASRLQRITTFGDEALIKASGTLATLAPALQTDELVKAQTAIAGIATTFTKGDTEAAAQLLGKTLGGTTNALGRYGIQVDTSASASEKLAQILGSGTLGASFEVAQEQAKTLRGRFQQLANVAGDMRELFGEVIAKALSLGENTGGLVQRIAGLNDTINANMDRWVAWTRVGIEAVKAVVISLVELIRMLWNVSQIGVRAFGVMALSIGAAFEQVLDSVARAANTLIEGLNALPGVNIDFRFEESNNRLWEGAQEQAAALRQDVDDLTAAAGRFGEAWARVGRQVLSASFTGAGNSDPLGVGSSGGGGGGSGSGGGGGVDLSGLGSPGEASGGLLGNLGLDLPKIALRQLQTTFKQTAEVATQELGVIQREVFSLAAAFADTMVDAAFDGMAAFRAFAEEAIRQLARVAARMAVMKVVDFFAPGVGSILGTFLGLSGPVTNPGGVTTASAQRSFAISLDVSGMPAPADPRQAARDGDWLRFLHHSNRAIAAGGG